MKKVAILGFGSRGRMFAKLISADNNVMLVGIADTEESARVAAVNVYGVKPENCYHSADEFFSKGKICDAVFICTQDSQHYDMVMKSLAIGYDICLEKPAAVTIDQCVAIRDEAKLLHRKVMLTHVLRYAPFYQIIKRKILDGALGDIVTITQTENIAYWHFCLSYVRGPWRDMQKSTPTILAKCCHDLDIIKWLINDDCVAVSSFGSLMHFNSKNAPKGSAEYCADCADCVKENCIYNAYKVYPERMETMVVGGTAHLKGRNIVEVLDNREDVIGKCVYHSDNNAVDNQVVNMQFANGATAQLTMNAFSQRCYRYIKVHGTKGEIYGDAERGILYYTKYGQKEEIIDVAKEMRENNVNMTGGHGGGDGYLYQDFIDYISENPSPSITRTTIDDSIQSHLIGFKAEESRLNGGAVCSINDERRK